MPTSAATTARSWAARLIMPESSVRLDSRQAGGTVSFLASCSNSPVADPLVEALRTLTARVPGGRIAIREPLPWQFPDLERSQARWQDCWATAQDVLSDMGPAERLDRALAVFLQDEISDWSEQEPQVVMAVALTAVSRSGTHSEPALKASAKRLLTPTPFWSRPKAKKLAAGIVITLLLLVITLASQAASRSRTLRAEFQKLNHCPANDAKRGPCPGYQVDHREALICGGRDELTNLHWLAIDEHKAKTRVEVKLCRANHRSNN